MITEKKVNQHHAHYESWCRGDNQTNLLQNIQDHILNDLKKSDYREFISIEPHIASVFHEEEDEDIDPIEKAKKQLETYVEYGRRLEKIISEITV